MSSSKRPAAATVVKRPWRRILIKLAKWLFVSVLIGLLPTMIRALVLYVDDDVVTSLKLFGGGELFIVAAGLTASGVGEVFFEWRSSRDGPHVPHAISVILSLLVLSVGAAMYSRADSYALTPTTAMAHSTSAFVTVSIVVFVSALVCSASCIALSEMR